jgi:glycosyltransferase involved in cell wall biosynthesis
MYVLNSSDLSGGATVGLLQLLKHLRSNDYRAYLVLPDEPLPYEASVLRQLSDDISVVSMGGGWTKSSRSVFRRLLSEGAQAVRTLFYMVPQLQLRELMRRWEIDLVYTNSVMVLDGALAARLNGRPHIWHVKERIGRGENTRFYVPDPLPVSVICALSSIIIVMSKYIAEPFAQHRKMDKVEIVYDGIDLELFADEKKGVHLRRRLHVASDEWLVGMIASLGAEWKRHEIFIEMAARLKERVPKVRFVHFGKIPDPSTYHWEYYQHLCELVHRLGLDDRFIWGGVIEDVAEMMDALDVLVHPCDTEPFGRVAIEAMAARKPVVGPDRGGIAESIMHNETGFLVQPGNAIAFADATEILLKDSNLRGRMGNLGHSRVEERFTIQEHAKRIRQLFDLVTCQQGQAYTTTGVNVSL